MKLLKILLSRVTSSDRGESFSLLIWPFFLATFAYGVGFLFGLPGANNSSLFASMYKIQPYVPNLWGVLAVTTIVLGLLFQIIKKPAIGASAGLAGFMLWIFACYCWGFNSGWIAIFSVGIPNAYFWFWQYISVGRFMGEQRRDKETMRLYDAGEYDEIGNEDSQDIREHNRGMDWQ